MDETQNDPTPVTVIPDPFATRHSESWENVSTMSQDVSTDDEPICRICHDGDRVITDSSEVLDTLNTLVNHDLLYIENYDNILKPIISTKTTTTYSTTTDNNNNNNTNNIISNDDDDNDNLENTTEYQEKLKLLASKIVNRSESDELIAPCKCKGTMKYVHRRCLNCWRYSRGVSGVTNNNNNNQGPTAANNGTATVLAGLATANQQTTNSTSIRNPRYQAFYQCERCGYPYKLNHSILSRTLSNTSFQKFLARSLFICLWLVSVIMFKIIAAPTIKDGIEDTNNNNNDNIIMSGTQTYYLDVLSSYNAKAYQSDPTPLNSICSKVFGTSHEEYLSYSRKARQFASERSLFKRSTRYKKPAVQEGYGPGNAGGSAKTSNDNQRDYPRLPWFVSKIISFSFDYFDVLRSNPRFFCPILKHWPPFVFFNTEDILESPMLNRIFLWTHANWEPLAYGTTLTSLVFFIFVSPATHMVINIVFMAYRAQNYNYAIDMLCLCLFLILGLSNTYLQIQHLVCIHCENFVRSKLSYVEDAYGHRSTKSTRKK